MGFRRRVLCLKTAKKWAGGLARGDKPGNQTEGERGFSYGSDFEGIAKNRQETGKGNQKTADGGQFVGHEQGNLSHGAELPAGAQRRNRNAPTFL